MAYDIKGIHERAAVWSFPYFMNVLQAVALNANLMWKSKSSHHRFEERLTIYCHVENHLLETFAINDVIAERDHEIACHVKLSTMSPFQFANVFCLKAPRCSKVHEEYVRKAIFVEGLSHTIRHNVQAY